MTDRAFRDRMMEAMAEQKLSMAELARRSGVSYDIVRDLSRRPGSSTSAERASKIAGVLGIAIAGGPRMHGLEESAAPMRDTSLVPVYDVAASAGFGSVVDYEAQTHSLAFPPDYLRKLTRSSPGNLAIISVKGESMEPTLLDDDIVLVDMSKKNIGYDGMFVLMFDDVLHVKRIGRGTKGGTVTVISDNSTFPDFDRSLGDIQVVGKVLWYGRKV